MITRILNGLTLMLLLAAGPVIGAEHVVNMLNNGQDGTMVFEPGFIKVAPGDSILFKSVDPAHNSQSFFTPDGAQPWTGEISKDVTVTFEKEGVYLYKCLPHTALAMVGVVQVGNAVNKDAAAAAASEFAQQFAMNKDRFDKYMAQVQ